MASSFSSRALEELVGCAEAIEAGDLRIADSRLDGILTLAAEQPEEDESEVQLVKYYAEALVRRAYGLQHPAAANFILHLYPTFFWIGNWWWGSLKTSIRGGIQKELMGKKRFHLIDFYIPHLYGENDYLFDALPVPESCNNGRLSVRVSVVLPPCLKEIVNVERENDYLIVEAGRFNLIMEERLKVVYANSLSASVLELGRRQDEAVLVFYSNKLQTMLGEEGVLERELMKLRDINPDVVIIAEQSAELHHSDYIKRFKDSFHYYSLALQTYGCYGPKVDKYYRRQIGSGVRLQTLDQWTSRLEHAHFSQLPLKLDDEVLDLEYSNNNGCLVSTSDDSDHPLEFISAWKLKDSEPHLIPIRQNLSNPIGSNQIPPKPSQLYQEGLSLNRLAALIEIYDMEEYMYHKYDLSDTVTWVYKADAKKLVPSIEHDYSYECSWHYNLSQYSSENQQCVVEQVLQSKMPFHFEPRCKGLGQDHAVLTICLHTHFGDDVYAVEFIWPSSKRTLEELHFVALDILNCLKNMTKKSVTLRINGTEDGFQEPVPNIPQTEPRDGCDVLETRELNQQGGMILNNSNVPPPSPTGPFILFEPNPVSYNGALETPVSHQQGCEKQPCFEALLSNSNEVARDEGNSQIPSVKRRKLRSDVWEHFYKEEREVGKQRAVCKYCHKDFDGSSKNGTTHLKNHFQRCKKVPPNVERTKSVGEGSSSFDQDRSNLDVARLIIKHQLPLDMVRDEYFGVLLKNLQPAFKLQPPEDLTSDILRVYNEEKLKLLEHFDKLSCRFNLAIHLWVHNVEKTTYCCYVVLFIDENWELKKRVLALKPLGPEFDARNVHESFKGVLADWKLDKKVFSLSMHDSSSSFEIIEEIRKTWLSDETSHPLGSFYITERDFNMLQNVGTSNPCLVAIYDMYKGPGHNGKKGYPLMDVKTDDNNLRTLSLVLAIQTVFDPRFKYEFVEFSYESIYGKHAGKSHLRIIDDALANIFNTYARPSSMNADVNSWTSLNGEENTIESFQRWCNSKKKDDLEAYLQEPRVKTIEFDLLGWWREQASSFPTLGRMARDILAIPMPSIISGSNLSEKAMLDNPIFNGLDPQTIEAMVCSCPIVKEAPGNADVGKKTTIWTEEDVKAYLVSPFSTTDLDCLSKLQKYLFQREYVGGDNIKGQSLAPLLMKPSPEVELKNQQNYYINDEVVNQFFILLKRRYERFPHKYLKHHSFDSAIVTLLINGSKTESQVLKRFDKEGLKDAAKLFLPMCLHQHWILFYADIDAKKLVWLDPLEHTRLSNVGEKQVIRRLFLEFILPSLGHDLKDWSFDVPNNIPSQKNSVDCALFVMKYADCLTHGDYLPFTQDDMPHFRHRTLLDLYHGSLCLGKGQSY